jgi:hypothetical protein
MPVCPFAVFQDGVHGYGWDTDHYGVKKREKNMAGNPNEFYSTEEKEAMADELHDHAESAATLQLEKIARAIRDLEGLPVDFRLARKLSEIQRMIADMHPLPVAPKEEHVCKPSCHNPCLLND